MRDEGAIHHYAERRRTGDPAARRICSAVAAAADAEEDAADAALCDACKDALANDPQGILPAEVSALLLRGERLATAIRKWRGLTQKEVARKLGMSQGALCDIENGRHRTGASTVRALAKIYDTPERWLMDLIGPAERAEE